MPVSSLVLACVLASAQAGDGRVELSDGEGRYRVDPATLSVEQLMVDGAQALMAPARDAGRVAELETAPSLAHWQWPGTGMRFEARIEAGRLHVTATASQPGAFDWPLAPVPEEAEWLLPDGQGRILAGDAPDLPGCRAGTGELSFPAWGYLADGRAAAFALADGLAARICWPEDAAAPARLHYDFQPDLLQLELAMTAGTVDPLAPARLYRDMLVQRGAFVSFADKSPEGGLQRLFGAPHAYLWGDGHSVDFLEALDAAGIERLVMTYDSWSADGDPSAFLTAADAGGWLAGPYETFANVQPTDTADATTSIWDGLYPAGCVRQADGARQAGFGGRGCELSSEALRRQDGPPSAASRYAGHVALGARHVFLDVDAFGTFFEDHDPDHPMSRARDRQNRIDRMRAAILDHGLVLGSEHVGGWAHGVTHYSHGGNSANLAAIWPVLRDRERMGGYWPEERPRRYFQPAELTEAEVEALFSPADRLPLFEAAFHDAVISTDRWEFGQAKFPALAPRRFALALLYGTPTLWHLDRRELDRVADRLLAAEAAFRRVHGTQAPAALTGFEWLSEDRLVQRTTFADGLTVTANFAVEARMGLGSNCVRAERTGGTMTICPPD